MRVFLLHGLGRSGASMWRLARRLKALGHRPSLFGYYVTFEPLERVRYRLVRHVEGVLQADCQDDAGESGPPPYAVIGHSLGNLITRMATPELPSGFQRFVMLAPPNQPPAIARALRNNPVFRLLSQDAGRKLTDPRFFATLPRPEVRTLIIAGTRGPLGVRLPFQGEPNDGILRVDETYLEGADHVHIHGVHTFLMNRRDVLEEIRRFLDSDETGTSETS